jgi:hypothetical protein
LEDEGIGPVEAGAPAVEETDKSSSRQVAAILDELYASVTTGIVKRPHGVFTDPNDDDRFVEDFVRDEISGVRYFGQKGVSAQLCDGIGG